MTSNDGGRTWSEPEKIVGYEEDQGGGVRVGRFAVAVGDQGDTYLAWTYRQVLYYGYRDAESGSWSLPLGLDHPVSPRPAVAVDHGGTVHVAWKPNDGEYLKYISSAYGRLADEPLVIQNIGPAASGPLLAAGGQEVYIAWIGAVVPAYPSETLHQRLFYSQRKEDGNWKDPVDASAPLIEVQSPDMAVDQQGAFHLVWWTPDAHHLGHVMHYPAPPEPLSAAGVEPRPAPPTTPTPAVALPPIPSWADMLLLLACGAGWCLAGLGLVAVAGLFFWWKKKEEE